MEYPKSLKELHDYRGKWVDAKISFIKNFPENTKFIVGREDKISDLPHICILCFSTTYLDERDKPVLAQGAVTICSDCYLKNLE